MSLVLGVEFLIVASTLGVLAFFVFFAASKSQGRLRLFGNALGWWLLTLTALAFVMLIVLPLVSPTLFAPRYDRWLNES